MAALTPEDIANMALAMLDEAPISSLDKNVKAARMLNLHYDVTREAELTKHAWVFAIFTAEATASDLGDGRYAYELPDDCLRLLPITYDGEPDGMPIPWRQEAGLIYSDQSGPLKLRYIANLTDPNDWDALFTDVFTAALAVKIAHPITHKAGMIELARNAYDRALADAQRVNAIQRSGSLYQQSWASARGDNRFWRP